MIVPRMYLRPGNLFKDFLVEESCTTVSTAGRPVLSYKNNGTTGIRGVLAEADPRQKRRWEQLQHPITHTIVQMGRPRAKEEDKLVMGERVFLVQGLDEAGDLGICTIYYVEERLDVR